MNTRFSYNLLKVFTKKRPAGFALPLVVMTGTVILVVGAAMMVKGTNDQNQAISQKASASSMAATETGLARVQSMMNELKFVLKYDMSEWSDAMTLSNDGTTVAFANNSDGTVISGKVTEIATSSACSASSSDVTDKENAIKAKLASLMVTLDSNSPQGVDIDPNDPSKGKFVLKGYQYNSGVGTLDIQGIFQGGAVNASKRVEVDIPVTDSPVLSDSSPMPGLWIKKGGINDGNNVFETSSTTSTNTQTDFESDIYFTDCSDSLSDTYVAAVNSTNMTGGKTAKKMDVPFPSLPYKPTGSAQVISSASTFDGSGQTAVDGAFHYIVDNSGNATTTTCITTGPPSQRGCTTVTASPVTVDASAGAPILIYNEVGDVSAESFPRATDIQSSDGKYRYLVGNISSSGGSDLEIDTTADPDSTTPGANAGVIFYMTGDMSFSGSGGLDVSCASGTSDAACSEKFQLYGYKTDGELCLKGTSDSFGYILAPDYDIGVTGNSAFVGSLFGRSWGKLQSCGSVGNHVAVRQVATVSEAPLSFKPADQPRMGAFSGYKTKPVN